MVSNGVSTNNAALNVETSVQRGSREARNTDHARRCEEVKNAAREVPNNEWGNPWHFLRNLEEEFFCIGNQQEIEHAPSANLVVATHKLDRLPQTSEIAKVRALLQAVHVNQPRNGRALSHRTASVQSLHRSAGQ